MLMKNFGDHELTASDGSVTVCYFFEKSFLRVSAALGHGLHISQRGARLNRAWGSTVNAAKPRPAVGP